MIPLWVLGGSEGISTPTFSVADNGDGTGGVVTIASSDPAAVNYFYAAPTIPSGSPYVLIGQRTGNGTLALASLAGDYTAYVVSIKGAVTSTSLVGSFTLTVDGVGRQTGHYWIDVKTTLNGDGAAVTQAAFFPVSLRDDHEPTCLASLRDRPSDHSNVILGCQDGYLRRFQRDVASDDGYGFESYFDVVIPLGGDGLDGILSEIQGVVAAASGDVDWAVRVGQTFEAAFNASDFTDGTWAEEGLSYADQPRARGKACVIRLSNGESGVEWSVEGVLVIVESGGRQRR